MTENATKARQWSVRHFLPYATDEDLPAAETAARHEVIAALREQVRNEGYVLLTSSVTPTEDRVAITITDADRGEFVPWDGTGTPSGWIVTWTASATYRTVDDGDAEPVERTGTIARFDVPADITADGGSLRMHHGYGGPVTCYAYAADGSRTGYLFASMVDDDVEAIDLLPGVVRVTVEPDPEDENA